MKHEISNSGILKNFIFKPIKSGFLGFASFLIVLLITKFISYVIGTIDQFNFELDDLILSSIGFVLLFLIRFLENFSEKETEKFV